MRLWRGKTTEGVGPELSLCQLSRQENWGSGRVLSGYWSLKSALVTFPTWPVRHSVLVTYHV
jgi:hypothetical protein